LAAIGRSLLGILAAGVVDRASWAAPRGEACEHYPAQRGYSSPLRIGRETPDLAGPASPQRRPAAGATGAAVRAR